MTKSSFKPNIPFLIKMINEELYKQRFILIKFLKNIKKNIVK